MSDSKIAIVGGKLFINNGFRKGTLLIHGKKIYKVIYENGTSFNRDDFSDYKIIDAAECLVSFGFFDPHVHLRTPGLEYKEDWESGSKAAIKGGFTYVADMPNTNPPSIDRESLDIKSEIAKKSKINYGLYIGLTDENSKDIGKNYYSIIEDSKINLLGIKVFLGSSTGSLLVKNEESIKSSLSTRFINLFHCEDEATLQKYKNDKCETIYDYANVRPDISEVSALYKIIKNANKDSKIYICHISSKKLAKEIKRYRKKGYNIITEISPHHLYFCDENMPDNKLFKVNPPIRTQKDLYYLRKQFNKGFFDVVASDHAPHTIEEKSSDNPPSGMPGLETTFYVLMSLYQNGIIKKKRIFKQLTSGYKIFSIKNRGDIKPGNFADITIVQRKAHKVTNDTIVSKAHFSPYDGLATNYSIKSVIIDGNIVFNDGEFIE